MEGFLALANLSYTVINGHIVLYYRAPPIEKKPVIPPSIPIPEPVIEVKQPTLEEESKEKEEISLPTQVIIYDTTYVVITDTIIQTVYDTFKVEIIDTIRYIDTIYYEPPPRQESIEVSNARSSQSFISAKFAYGIPLSPDNPVSATMFNELLEEGGTIETNQSLLTYQPTQLFSLSFSRLIDRIEVGGGISLTTLQREMHLDFSNRYYRDQEVVVETYYKMPSNVRHDVIEIRSVPFVQMVDSLFTETYTYLGIPIWVQYKWLQRKRFSLFVDAGASLSYLIDSSIDDKSLSHNDSQFSQKELDFIYRVGFGISYSPIERIVFDLYSSYRTSNGIPSDFILTGIGIKYLINNKNDRSL